MPAVKSALALLLSLSLAAPSVATVRAVPLKSLPIVAPAAAGAAGGLSLPILNSIQQPAPLVLSAKEHLSLFRTQPPAMALGTLLTTSASDPAAAVVLQAVAAQVKDPAALSVIAANLGQDAALQIETIAEALPKLANTDRKLRAALIEVRKALRDKTPALSAEKIAAFFDGGAKSTGAASPVNVSGAPSALPNGLNPARPSKAEEPADVPPAPGGKIRALNAKRGVKILAASLYRPVLFASRALLGAAGSAYRRWRGLDVDEYRRRWGTLEDRYKTGATQSETMDEAASRLSAQTASIGGAQISPMIGVSGMSFPQLSAQSHLSLLYINLKLAKEHGTRILHNTGEGGPRFHLAMLEGDRDVVLEEVVRWNIENGQFKAGSWDHAKIESFVDSLMASRNAIFKEFSTADLARAQIVAQFGSALNGVRGPGMSVDYEKLKRVADSPFTAMVQYKLKQAAKRGAKVDPRKVDDFVAALRDLPRNKPFKSPELNPEMSSYESIAELIKKTRAVTAKPVSLKFGVGDPRDLYAFLAHLSEQNALPDHIQLDGRGVDFSPGSGNAPPGANTSLPINEAVLVTNAVLKRLGIRDRIFLEATGDILEPKDALERLALGADGISGARCWMGMGLGCAQVRACANGNCPYGIAAKSDSFVGLALDPRITGPKGAKAAAAFRTDLLSAMAELGVKDWRKLRDEHGLSAVTSRLKVSVGGKQYRLDEIYDFNYAKSLLEGTLSAEEVSEIIFAGRTPQGAVFPQPEISPLPATAFKPAKAKSSVVGSFYPLKLALVRAWTSVARALAALIRPLQEPLHTARHHLREMRRHYLDGRDADLDEFRWQVIEGLHEHGDFRGSFGHPVPEGLNETLSPVVFREAAYQRIRWQKNTVGEGGLAIALSPAVSYSGMPFLSLSVQEHLALLYTHLKLAQDRGGHTLFAAGEHGWRFYRALLQHDANAIEQAIGERLTPAPGSFAAARIRVTSEEAARKSAAMLAEFTQEDLDLVQFVAQFSHPLSLSEVDQLKHDPYAKVIQLDLTGGLDSDAARLAELIGQLRGHTGKPVSLRMSVVSPAKSFKLLSALKAVGALPDHLQVEGRGPRNPEALPIDESVIAVDALLRKLGVRNAMYLDAVGGSRLPMDAVTLIALGADGASSGKAWLAMAAGWQGRGEIGALSDDGIVERSLRVSGFTLDPEGSGKKGFVAAANWAKSFVQTLAETGVSDWRDLREHAGLSAQSPVLRRRVGPRMLSLRQIYTQERIEALLAGALTPEEVQRFVFQP